MQISVLIVTNRCDQRFIKCLNSVKFADEILILDNNSGNNWKKLSRTYDFKTIPYPQKIEDFAKVRNQLIEKAKYTWILFLDSDEELEKSAESKISKLIKEDRFSAALIKRSDYFHGKKMSWGELRNKYLLRLGKRQTMKFSRSVHEIANSSGNVYKSNIEIKHYPHQDLSEFFSKISLYSEMEAIYRYKQYQPWEAMFELIFFPPLKFLFNFVFKLGFLDGWRGLIYAVMMSIHSANVRVFIYELLQENRKK